MMTFDVDDQGVLSVADFEEARTRAELYEDVADFSRDSPSELILAIDACPPLGWELQSTYGEVREEIQAELQACAGRKGAHKKRARVLAARLKTMPEDASIGTEGWLLSLTTTECAQRVTPVLDAWFAKPPNWSYESEFVSDAGTAQGAALRYFSAMDARDLETIGVLIVEGEHPGSSYYAAELHADLDSANAAAKEAGIKVVFRRTCGK